MGRKELELLPADLITAVVTDLRILPPSAAPAVLKAKDLEAEWTTTDGTMASRTRRVNGLRLLI